MPAVAERIQSISIWPRTAPGDPVTHFWYDTPAGGFRTICDDSPWLSGRGHALAEPETYSPCLECRGLYVEDIVSGEMLMDASKLVDGPPVYVVPYPKTHMVPTRKKGIGMEIKQVPITSFARFYGATGPQKVKIVRDARQFQSDPRGYGGRDYYMNFRNALKRTHWRTDDIVSFEAELDSLVAEQRNEKKQEHYRELGEAYINFWKKHDAQFFEVPKASLTVAGLNIRVVTEVGMRYSGENLALKLLMTAPRPTRQFRQAVQHITAQSDQPPDLQPAMWDVRREEILQPVSIPRDFQIMLEGQAVAFQQIWDRLGTEEED